MLGALSWELPGGRAFVLHLWPLAGPRACWLGPRHMAAALPAQHRWSLSCGFKAGLLECTLWPSKSQTTDTDSLKCGHCKKGEATCWKGGTCPLGIQFTA